MSSFDNVDEKQLFISQTVDGLCYRWLVDRFVDTTQKIPRTSVDHIKRLLHGKCARRIFIQVSQKGTSEPSER